MSTKKIQLLGKLDNVHVITESNKNQEIPPKAVLVVDTTQNNTGDVIDGSGTVIDGSIYMPNFFVTDADNGKVLGVVNGDWAVMEMQTSGSGSGGTGEAGFSPTVDVTPISGGHRVIITDKDGPHTFNVLDGTIGQDGKSAYEIALEINPDIGFETDWIASLKGQNGKSAYEIAKGLDSSIGTEKEWIASLKGENGQNGITPVREVHYWTEADKAEIKSYVDAAILGGEW